MKICLNILYLTARDPFLFYIHPCKPPLSDAKLRNAWVEELGTEITDNMWEAILIKIYNSSINVRHRLTQFKIVHRLHYTKSRLHAIYRNVCPLCDKCSQDTGALAHELWLCPKLHSFWSRIFDYISKAYSKTITPDLFLAIFGISVYSLIDKHIAQAISLCTLLAKRLILQQWKSELSPIFHQWLRALGIWFIWKSVSVLCFVLLFTFHISKM